MEELHDLLADEAATAAVQKFVQEFELLDSRTSINGDYITVQVSIATAEKMLNTQYYQYTHAETGDVLHRCESYELPEEVAAAVNFVGHTTSLSGVSKVKPYLHLSGLRGADAAGQATPSVLSSYYGVAQNDVKNPKATQAVFETIGQSYAPADLTKYDNEFNVPPQTISKVIGPNSPSSCSANPNNCVEAELDVQVMTAIAQEGTTVFWSIPGSESFLQWIDAVANDANPPLVHSISYGAPETDEPSAQAMNFDKEVAKMGLRGLTVFVASGDDGVAGSSARGDKSQCGFNPSYPATAPHVTAVGATQGPEMSQPEIACQSNKGGGITSGGGFSTLFDRPSWQSSQVSNYLSTGPNLPPKSDFASNGRGYPDVGLMGHNYPIVVGGQTYAGSGTSASTPLFAAMVTLVNSARLSAGMSSVGFLNPQLYQLSSDVFNDITSGENQCTAGAPGSAVCCSMGFTAATGWDPITGLGSVHFPKFLSALSS